MSYLDDDGLEATRRLNRTARKIEVGEYVKYRDGTISKVLDIDENSSFDLLCEKFTLSSVFVVKHSKNIIDLIEVGDIVETYDVLNNDIIYIWSEDMLKALKEDVKNGIKIKSILTHEQFAQISYKVKE